MKTLLLVLLFGFLSGPTQTVKIKTSAICEMCKERIEKNLALTKGVEKSDLNLEDQSNITVVYNPDKIDVAKIKQVIAETGYDADDVKAIKKSFDKLPSCCKK
ncbi:heavy metal-associated domain-containing protein [Aquirufa sp. OSTEICH-129V]|jgi:copper chaperone CopZ|uniref:Heavy metal-associated domain-containing protein n=1 Tax=Aquirufa avitistagni TaxID=3104728 RepID=A0ABW6DF30_9BACT